MKRYVQIKNERTLFLFLGIIFLLVLSCHTISFALAPPTHEQVEKYIQDGSWPERVAAARAIGNYKMAPELVNKLNYKLQNLSQRNSDHSLEEIDKLYAPPLARQGMPSTGDVNIFVLLIDFNEYPHLQEDTQASINTKIFGPENTSHRDYPYESLHAYYARSSYGLLNLRGTTFAWYNAGNRSDVIETYAGREALIVTAINHFDARGHDFSQYDNDNDGDIDYFAVIWSGPYGEWADFWWPSQRYWTETPQFTVDGKKLDKYSWQEESYSYPDYPFTPRMLIHETGHGLGLPDYYDYDDYDNDGYSIGPAGGVGGLDMMDDNIGDHNAFSKFVLDWVNPTVISNFGDYPSQNLSASSSADSALLVMPNASGSPFEEFFLVQYRDRTKNDVEYPADGLLIWHVNAELNSSGYNYKYDNSYTDFKLLRLIEADGLEEIENRTDWADAGDYYTDGDAFTPFSTPNSNMYSGEPS